jgi:hypothetical protein
MHGPLFETYQSPTDSPDEAVTKGRGLYVSRAIAHSFSGELKYEPVRRAPVFAVELIPLREWQKVTGEYGSATAGHQNSSR